MRCLIKREDAFTPAALAIFATLMIEEYNPIQRAGSLWVEVWLGENDMNQFKAAGIALEVI